MHIKKNTSSYKMTSTSHPKISKQSKTSIGLLFTEQKTKTKRPHPRNVIQQIKTKTFQTVHWTKSKENRTEMSIEQIKTKNKLEMSNKKSKHKHYKLPKEQSDQMFTQEQ